MCLLGGLYAPVSTSAQSSEPASLLWGRLSPGKYPVGYRSIESSGMLVHVWYPSRPGGRKLLMRDYLRADSAQVVKQFAGFGPSMLDSLLGSRLYASRLVPRAAGRPRVVLVAQGNGEDVFDQVVLCEYLASQGFVVLTTPSPMLRTPLEREDQVGTFAEQQAQELLDAVKIAARVVRMDTTRIGVVGHSFGARSALLLAMRDRRVRALVSLDGGIGTSTAIGSFRGAPSFRASAALPSILHFYEELDAFMTPDFSLLRGLRTESLTLEPTRGMHHVHFSTLGFMVHAFANVAVATQATAETNDSVIAVTTRTFTFLRDVLGRSR